MVINLNLILCSDIQIFPAYFCTLEITKHIRDNDGTVGKSKEMKPQQALLLE